MLRFFIYISLLMFFLLVAALIFYYASGYGGKVDALRRDARAKVRASSEADFRASQTSLVYDAKGDLISVLKGEKDVYYLEFDEIPTDVFQAFISIEDKKFYRHNGIDLKAIIRAAKSLIKNKKITQGASTITQQLSRDIFLTQEVSWTRKVEEIFIALDLEKKYSKNKILEYYVNNIYFANGYYGIEAASKGYFDCSVKDLDLSQIAFLCAIPNNPTLYNPLENYDNTIKRRDRILKQLREDGKITAEQYRSSTEKKIRLNPSKKVEKKDYVETYVYSCAIRQLMNVRGFKFRTEFSGAEDKENYQEIYEATYNDCQRSLYTSGYRIYTSIDMKLQKQLQKSINENLKEFTEKNEEGIYTLQAAATCIDNETGMVKAIVGGRNQDLPGYTLNRAYQSYRQPGSSIKPILVYLPALEKGYTPDTQVNDEPIPDGPSNAGDGFLGWITLRQAVANSVNTVAWRLLEELHPETGFAYLQKMNFSKIVEEDYRLTSALGGLTNGVNTVEMASAYCTVEHDGLYRQPDCIQKITDSEEQTLYQQAQEEVRVYEKNASRMMTSMMESVITEGTGYGLDLTDMPAAGKTGTTNDNKDGWFVGYTAYYTTSVWVGYDMPKELPGLTGASYPGAIWKQFMEKIHKNLPKKEFLPYLTYEDEQEKKIAPALQTPQEVPPEAPVVEQNPDLPQEPLLRDDEVDSLPDEAENMEEEERRRSEEENSQNQQETVPPDSREEENGGQQSQPQPEPSGETGETGETGEAPQETQPQEIQPPQDNPVEGQTVRWIWKTDMSGFP